MGLQLTPGRTRFGTDNPEIELLAIAVRSAAKIPSAEERRIWRRFSLLMPSFTSSAFKIFRVGSRAQLSMRSADWARQPRRHDQVKLGAHFCVRGIAGSVSGSDCTRATHEILTWIPYVGLSFSLDQALMIESRT